VKLGQNGPTLATNNQGDLVLSKEGGQPVRISGVADGRIAEDSTDAVNGSQVYRLERGIDAKLQKTTKSLSAGVAGAYAMANLIHTRLPGERNVSVAGGYYKGQSAVALGFSATSDNGKITIRVSGTQNSSGDFGAGVGASYHW
ncbi:surface protein, partial [[Haemophilus] felis]|nr:surface protein [[Haemophilus] felis]